MVNTLQDAVFPSFKFRWEMLTYRCFVCGLRNVGASEKSEAQIHCFGSGSGMRGERPTTCCPLSGFLTRRCFASITAGASCASVLTAAEMLPRQGLLGTSIQSVTDVGRASMVTSLLGSRAIFGRSQVEELSRESSKTDRLVSIAGTYARLVVAHR